MKVKGMKQAGFSLVELMVVVGIIGILAAIAVPKLQVFTAKAKQSEAKTNLKSIDTFQQAHFAENGTYGDAAAIGASGLVWKHYTAAWTFAATTPNAYSVKASTANKLCPGATNAKDEWQVDQSSIVSQTAAMNGLTGC